MTFLDEPLARRQLTRLQAGDVAYISPREIKGRKVYWAILKGEIGRALVAVSDGAICWISMDDLGDQKMRERFFAVWKQAELVEKQLPVMKQALLANPPPLPLLLAGTAFQQEVWRLLLRIPRGNLVRYGDIAAAMKKPNASRAVGNSVGSNPVTWLVPCHRVGHSNGSLHGFGWGEACKRRFLGLEINGLEPANTRASNTARAAAAPARARR